MAADTLAGIDIKPLAVRDPFNLRPNYSDEIGNVRHLPDGLGSHGGRCSGDVTDAGGTGCRKR